MPAFTIQAKVPDDILASLDEEAREQHTTRSAVVRRRLECDMPSPTAMDAEELARVVSQAARRGSIAAMKLRDEQLRRSDSPAIAADPLSELDELAARRPHDQNGDAA
jgi:hypothetical protein